MRPFDALFPLGMAALVGGVLLFAAFSGRLNPGVRRVIERLLAAIFYPAVAAFYGWKAFQAGRHDEVATALSYAVVAVGLVVLTVKILTARPSPAGEGQSQ